MQPLELALPMQTALAGSFARLLTLVSTHAHHVACPDCLGCHAPPGLPALLQLPCSSREDLAAEHMPLSLLALQLQGHLSAEGMPSLLFALQLQGELAAEDTPLFLGCFRHMAARPDVHLRATCAAVLPKLMGIKLPGALTGGQGDAVGGWDPFITPFTHTMGRGVGCCSLASAAPSRPHHPLGGSCCACCAGAGPDYFSDTLLDLSSDHEEAVRLAVAGGLAEVRWPWGARGGGGGMVKSPQSEGSIGAVCRSFLLNMTAGSKQWDHPSLPPPPPLINAAGGASNGER